MFRRAGVCGFAIAVAVGAAVTGCGQKGGGGIRPADAFGIADANVIVTGDLAGVAGSEFYVNLTKGLEKLPGFGGEEKKSINDTLKETLGLDPADVQRIVAHGNTDAETLVVVAVSKKPVDREAVLAALSKQGPKLTKQATHAGVDLFAEAAGDNEVMAFPAPNLVVAGTKDEVKKGIDRLKAGEALRVTGKAADILGAAPKGASLVVVAVPTPGLAKMAADGAPMPGAGEVVEKIAAVTVVVKAAKTLDLNVVVEFKTDKDAEDARKQAVEGLAGMKAMIGPMLEQGGMEPLKDLVNGVKVGGAAKSVDVQATVRADIAKTIPAIPGIAVAIMMQAMGGGMPGMGGGMPMGR